MKVEGLDYFIGKASSAGMRRGVALVPGLAKHATYRLAVDTEMMKPRRKAREKAAASKKG